MGEKSLVCEVGECNILFFLGTQCAGPGFVPHGVYLGVGIEYTRIRQQRLRFFFCFSPTTLSDIHD
jgi:hypothetical protein